MHTRDTFNDKPRVPHENVAARLKKSPNCPRIEPSKALLDASETAKVSARGNHYLHRVCTEFAQSNNKTGTSARQDTN